MLRRSAARFPTHRIPHDPQECGAWRQGNIALIHSAHTEERGKLPPLSSLRGAKRRSNPVSRRYGLLRFARNDGVDGPRTASMCQTGDVDSTRRREPSMGEISMIGLDLAKNVFQVHGVDASGEVVVRRQLRRGQVEKFFAQLPACTVGLEACGSAHHWARVIGGYGHQVRLMPPAYVKPYVKRNKNDGRDTEAICEAVNRPTMRFVPGKSVEQQAMRSGHRRRYILGERQTQ